MKKSKFTGEQVAFALRQAEVGTPVTEVCRKMGVSEATYCRWSSSTGGWVHRSCARCASSRGRTRSSSAWSPICLSTRPCSRRFWQKSLAPGRRREIVHWVQDRFRVSERRGCSALRFDRRTHRYKSICDDQAPLRKRIKEIAETRVRYGYRRIHVLLRREGWPVNVKRVRRLYRVEGLNLRAKRPRRHVMAARRVERPLASRPNEIWAMDFVSDALFNGRRIRALTVVDMMDRPLFERGMPPAKIRVDNGPEFISRALDHWAYINRVTLDFSRPGKPTDNAFVESFNGRLRDECLNTHWFLSLDDARAKIEVWRTDFNESRPHTSLGFRRRPDFLHRPGLTPADQGPDL